MDNSSTTSFSLLSKRVSVSTSGFFLYSPISVLAFPVTVLVSNPDTSPLLLLGYGIALTASIFPIYLIFVFIDSKIHSEKVAVKVAILILTTVTVGGFRGWLFYILVKQLGLIETGDIRNRIIASSFTALVWLSASNITIGYIREFKVRYQKAFNKFMMRNLESSHLFSPSVESKNELKQVQIDLFTTLGKLLKSDGNENLQDLAQALTNQINLKIRPLSKRIWLRSLGEYPSLRFRKMIFDAIRFLEFPSQTFIIIMSLLSLLNNSLIRSFTESLLRTISFMVTLLLVIMLRRKLYLRNNIIFLLIVGIIPIVISEAIMSNLGYSGSWNAAFLITPVAPVVLMTLSFLKLTQRDQDLIIQLLHTSNLLNENSKMMNPGVGERQLASFIHNSIQSEFLALAGQMQDAAKTGDKNHLLNLRNQVEEVVNRSFIHDFERFAKSPYERLRNVQESWNGLLNLNVDIPKEIFEIPDKAGIIVQTIEEFTANSYRHGKASHVTVTGRLGNSGVQLHLHSNGVESLVKKRGFGSEWLDQIAISDWNINVDASGTSLTIEI